MKQGLEYKSWTGSIVSDAEMNNAHHASWQGMIDLVSPLDLSQSTVLDFGCNQGGFLRYLFGQRPFKHGLGVDLARDSIEQARRFLTNEPITFDTIDGWSPQKAGFDLAFSHEVVYLLPNLDTHAAQIRDLLRQDGVYYIAIGAHADNPLWKKWQKLVAQFSPVAPQDYSLEDIALAFSRSGFQVQAQKMLCRAFIDFTPTSNYYETFKQKLDYYTDHFVLFRCLKKD